MKRIKERGPFFDQFEFVQLTITPPVGSPVIRHYGAEPFLSHWEYMADTVGQIQSDFNPCYHYKWINAGKPVDSFGVETAPGAYEFYQTNVGGVQVQDILGVLRGYDFGIDNDIEDFGASAEDHFLTAVQDKNSLLNFIIELIEVCEGNLKVVRTLSKKVENALETFWRVFKKTGNYWVAWNFAWKPTIGDILSWLTTMRRAEKRIKWLAAHNHRPVKVHYRKNDIEVKGVIPATASWFHHVPGGDPFVYPQPPLLCGEIAFEANIGLSAWAWVQFDIPDVYLFDLQTAINMAALTMQGIYNPAKIIWEAIPFSWLIEWFVNQRAQLLKEKASLAKLIFPDSVIIESGWTVHLKKCMGTATILSPGPSGTMRYDQGDYFLDIFDRRPGLPGGSVAFRFEALSALQSSILAAIGANTKRTGVRRR